jgi:hypothetical protein
LYGSYASGNHPQHLIERSLFLMQIVLFPYSHGEAEVPTPHLLKDRAKAVQGADEPVEGTKRMESSHADNGDHCGPDSCMQGKYLIGGTRSGFQTEAVILHANNIWHKKEDGQKKHYAKAVDKDNGEKSVLEWLIDNIGTPTLIPFCHEISFHLAPHKYAGSLRSRVAPI